jgi:hypothetical protein
MLDDQITQLKIDFKSGCGMMKGRGVNGLIK